MKNALLQKLENKFRRSNPVDFEIGDTVVVTVRIIEGEKERLQDFEGTVIARRGHGLDEMFTVRKIVANEGVERTFPLHSPKIAAIKTSRSGKVRRAKLYYLRDRVGKSRKLRERRITAEQRKAASEARTAKARAVAEAQEAVAASRAESESRRAGALAGTA